MRDPFDSLIVRAIVPAVLVTGVLVLVLAVALSSLDDPADRRPFLGSIPPRSAP